MTFGSLLIFSNNTTIVKASETVDNEQVTSTTQTVVDSNQKNTSETQESSIKNVNNNTENQNQDIGKQVNYNKKIVSNNQVGTNIQAGTSTSINDSKESPATTVIGNSVEDTQTYESIEQTSKKINQQNTGLNQLYFGLAGDAEIDQQAKALGATDMSTLNTNGYLIKSGLVDNQMKMVVQGKDSTGLYYALNTLNNLLSNKSSLTNVNITESPQMSIRGVIEGFYGQPWSQQARKDLFKFMGNHKMNVYIYSPKDDEYLRNNWKELYPQEKLNQIKELVDAARKNHVSFVYTLSPGNDITYSSQEDFDKTIAKFDQLRSIGVTQFYIALDDIPLGMTDADSEIFKNHPTTNYPNNPWSALADAQAFYINKVQREYIKKNNLPDLWLVPTNYSGSQQDPFKEAQGEVLDKDIRLQWTGEGVFSDKITKDSVVQAGKTYHSNHLFIWDNFPVNDSDQDRLYLNSLNGRDKDLYQVMDGFTSNPMIQPYASWFGLAGYGEYMWNANTYSPTVSLENTIHEMAGTDPQALVALQQFVDLNQYWDYASDSDKLRAPILSGFISNFENAEYGSKEYFENKQKLIERLDIIVNAPETLKNMKEIGFYNDSLPWINAASHWAKALLASIQLRDDINSGNANSDGLGLIFDDLTKQVDLATQKALPDSRTGQPDLVITPSVGDGVFQKFVQKTTSLLNNWLGASVTQAEAKRLNSEATTEIPHNENYLAENMNDTDLNTKFWSNRSIKVGDTIKVDLKNSQLIQRIDIHQGKSDDEVTGDMFKKATIYAANNEDGSDKIAIGEVTPTANFQLNLNQPIKARYLFVIATSSADNWLQIRNISVYNNTGLNIQNIQAIDNTTSKAIFDGNIQTSYAGVLSNPQDNGVIEQSFSPTNGMKNIYLSGRVDGMIYVHSNGEWKEIGRVTRNHSINKFAINVKEIDRIKLVLNSNQSDFVINDFGLSMK